jgi:DNA-binding NtrC family response regulator
VEALIQRGAFREDLFYRLNVCRAVLPPLRDRREEIVPLVWMFLRKFSEEFGHEFTAVEPQAMTMLERHDWPGNVREMRNVLTNIAIFEDGHRVTGEMVRRHLGAASPAADGEPGGSNERPRAGSAGPVSQAAEPPPADGAESESAGGRASASPTEHAPRLPVDEPFVLPEQPFDLDAFSRRVVAQALTRFGGNKSEAARFLGLSRTQLYGRYRDVEPDSDH